jgi:hypothetical protein
MSDALRQAAEQALDALDNAIDQLPKPYSTECAYAKDALRAQLEAPPQQAKPVAWRVRGYAQFKTGKPGAWRYFDGPHRPTVNDGACCDVEPLYTAPPALSAPQQAEPEGWVAVPKKPTQAMQENGAQEFAMTAQRVQTAERSASDIYRAMLAAARTTGLE